MNLFNKVRQAIRDLRHQRQILNFADPRVQAWAEHGVPSYDANNLVVWYQNVEFLTNPKFQSAYRRGMDSGHQIMRPAGSKEDIHIEWRVAIACWAAHHASRLAGDFVECGTNTGIVSLAICDYLDFNKLDKTFWLFDTFEGIPLEQISREERKAGRGQENVQWYPECFELATSNFKPYPRVRLIRGRVPDTLSTVEIGKVAYLHLDMNIAYPERAAIEYFWPKMPTGAIALLDDYGWSPYYEQKKILDEFAAGKGVEIFMLPTGQGILIKS
jgi:O-methyltransferase